ncbi:tRNA pseudouridine synthase-like 1 isoform X2 [Gasterosteus aculeatus]|uniref:tRNA pseudouridine synthase-like 1 n=1 Tax=Gasterosteus aculeatus aculeatus TaxID=481459 RepID=A0AAQ4Q571_GASAC|nr:tRNA pseudouridine synthase-like 1 isoform X2 [Gasterosteus aculeatus aculeatus]
MHNGARYLIFFQYIGKKYRGAVKAPSNQLGWKGVQDHLEDAIGKLKPLNTVSLSVSSRTDTGVNALSNSAHFDLQRRKDKPPFTAEILVEALNFNLGAEQIRITRAHRVPDDFHARFRAQSRTYVYRIALGISHNSKLPLTESDLCWNLRDKKLDVGAMREAAALLVGTQDFSSFRAVSSDIHIISPLKTLDVATVEPGSSFVSAHFHREIPFWELTFTARSFLYKQFGNHCSSIKCAEDDGGSSCCRPGAALSAPAAGDTGSSGLSFLPTRNCCSGPRPLPHQGGLQRN